MKKVKIVKKYKFEKNKIVKNINLKKIKIVEKYKFEKNENCKKIFNQYKYVTQINSLYFFSNYHTYCFLKTRDNA